MSLHYMLCCLGIPIIKPTILFSDNLGMIQNASIPTSDLKKKHIAISFHLVCEAAATGIVILVKVDSHGNYSDTCTKALAPSRHTNLVNDLFWQLTAELKAPSLPRHQHSKQMLKYNSFFTKHSLFLDFSFDSVTLFMIPGWRGGPVTWLNQRKLWVSQNVVA